MRSSRVSQLARPGPEDPKGHRPQAMAGVEELLTSPGRVHLPHCVSLSHEASGFMPLWYLRVVLSDCCSGPPQLYPRKDTNHLLHVSLPSAIVSHLNVRLAVSFDAWLADSTVPHIADAIGAELCVSWEHRNSEGQLRCRGQGRDNAERLRGHKMAPKDMWLREFPGSGRAKADIGGALTPTGSMCSGRGSGIRLQCKPVCGTQELSGKSANCLGQEGCL